MSRCKIKSVKENVTMEVGLDKPMSCWFGHAYLGEEVFDSLWKTVNASEICEWMRENGVDFSDQYTLAVYGQIAMDLDPGSVPSSDGDLQRWCQDNSMIWDTHIKEHFN